MGQGQPCWGQSHSWSWLEAGILGGGDHGNIAYFLSSKSGDFTGQRFGLHSKQLKAQRQQERPLLALPNRGPMSPPQGGPDGMPAACTNSQEAWAYQGLALQTKQEPTPLGFELRDLVIVT